MRGRLPRLPQLRRPAPLPRRRAAFTLLEVLVVVALLALTALAVVPAFAGQAQRSPERRTADALAELLRGARDAARERGMASTVTIVPADGRWWIQQGDSSRTGRIELASGTVLVAGADRVECRFAPTGAATAVAISVRGERALRVRTAPWTGDVTVDEAP